MIGPGSLICLYTADSGTVIDFRPIEGFEYVDVGRLALNPGG
jgi:hypothetical protein